MVHIEELAAAALEGRALILRSLVQDWLLENARIADSAPPRSEDPTIRAVAAALVELFAQRSNQAPPSWSGTITAVPSRVYLVQSAATMPRLRHLCDTESPAPLKQRNLFAPPSYLEFV